MIRDNTTCMMFKCFADVFNYCIMYIPQFLYKLKFVNRNMANFDEMANLFAIQNLEEQENVARYGRLIIVRENRVNPFTLSDRLFIKMFRLTKDLTLYLIEILTPFIEVKRRSSSIDLSTKVN